MKLRICWLLLKNGWRRGERAEKQKQQPHMNLCRLGLLHRNMNNSRYDPRQHVKPFFFKHFSNNSKFLCPWWTFFYIHSPVKPAEYSDMKRLGLRRTKAPCLLLDKTSPPSSSPIPITSSISIGWQCSCTEIETVPGGLCSEASAAFSAPDSFQ